VTWLRFQAVERSSAFTHLDFRSKLVLMLSVTIVAFLWENPWLDGALTLAVVIVSLTAGVKGSYIIRVVQLMLPLYVIIWLTHGFFNTIQVATLTGQRNLTYLISFPAHWWLIGGGGVTWEGLLYGTNVVLKTMTLTLVLPLVVLTSDVDNMVVALVRARVPYKLAFVFSATLRFVPLLFDEMRAVVEAQRLRGLAVERMGPLRRVRVYARVAVPLMLGAMLKSQQVEIALQSRAFGAMSERTYMHETKLVASDYVVMVGSAGFLVLAVLGYVVWGIGRFAV